MKHLLFLVILIMAGWCEGKTLIVDPAGTGDSKTLSGAVGLADDGDTIIVRPGEYSGVALNRSLILKGTPEAIINGRLASALIIAAPGCEISGLALQASGSGPAVIVQSSDNTLSGCLVHSSSSGVQILADNNTLSETRIKSAVGIDLSGDGCRLLNNSLEGDIGIKAANAAGNEIAGCSITSATGMEIESSHHNRIQNNVLSGMRFGIVITDSTENQISNNTMSGLYVSAVDVVQSRENNLSSNRITGGKIGISLRRSDDNLLSSNLCQKSERAGIYSDSSIGNTIKDSQISLCGNGILLSASSNCTLQNNRVANSTYGISLRGSVRNRLRDNSLDANLYNIRVDAGEASSAALASSRQDFFLQDIDSSNLVGGKPVCYLVKERDLEIADNCGFVGLIECENLTVTNQSISNNSAGLIMVNSTRCRISSSSFSSCESGICILQSRDWIVENCRAATCSDGFLAVQSPKGTYSNDLSRNCTGSAFRAEDCLNLTFQDCTAESSSTGMMLAGSRLCQVYRCRADQNREDGIMLSLSHKCDLRDNWVISNQRGVSLSGSNSCLLWNNSAQDNRQDGFFFGQLFGAEVAGNRAERNGQGIFVQSAKKLNVSSNELSANSRFGLRMSGSQLCNITDNLIRNNQLSGANLVDCSDNVLYHNEFVDNGLQNAQDNGENEWDNGPIVGGNYWSDHTVQGNPGKVPRQIPSKGTDRYPFQDPGGWK